MKSVTTAGRHMWTVIATIIFNRKDCYVVWNTTC